MRGELRALGRAGRITAVRRPAGGVIAGTWLITYANGTSVVGKTLAGAAPGLCRIEAGALRATGHLATPQVLAVTGRLLLLEALAARDDSERSGEAFDRDLAAAHRGTTGDRFGWHHDGYLGRLRQVSTWIASGHEFFAGHRLPRYLSEPAAGQALTAACRRAVERLCARLPEVIPVMPAVLAHGDLWAANPASPARRPDRRHRPGHLLRLGRSGPVHAVVLSRRQPPGGSSGLYHELNPSPPGWAGRMPLLHLRELLSVIAHFSPTAASTVQQGRRTLTPFYPRLNDPRRGPDTTRSDTTAHRYSPEVLGAAEPVLRPRRCPLHGGSPLCR
jgi:fructosamine-3-kinase